MNTSYSMTLALLMALTCALALIVFHTLDKLVSFHGYPVSVQKIAPEVCQDDGRAMSAFRQAGLTSIRCSDGIVKLYSR